MGCWSLLDGLLADETLVGAAEQVPFTAQRTRPTRMARRGTVDRPVDQESPLAQSPRLLQAPCDRRTRARARNPLQALADAAFHGLLEPENGREDRGSGD